MSKVTVRFVGPWRLYLGASSAVIHADTVEQALEMIEAEFDSRYQARLAGRGIKEKRTITGDSNVLLNRVHIRELTDHTLKDGDQIDLIPRFVGG